MTIKTIAAFAACIAFSAFSYAAPEPYRIGAPAAWVKVAPPPTDVDLTPVEQGQSDFLLVDYQVRVASVTERYTRYVERLVNQETVDDGAQLSFEFDPAHERVIVHEVRVRRDGRSLDKLEDSRRSLLNRETDLDDGLINGRVTLHVLLQDIRVGDTLDYSYTIERRDPISERGYNDWYSTQWGVPVRHVRLRVLNAEQRPLLVRDLGKLGEPRLERSGGWVERTWEARDIVAVRSEDSRPDWHIFYPRIELTEFADWSAVRAWAEPLYVVPNSADAPLRALIKDIESGTDESARILKALRFVQDDIRYTGIEIGAGAYRPTAPATVLARRFGDCKDKVLLLVTVLRKLGIEAYPALVHSTRGKALNERAPSPGVFNHVIAKVRSQGRDFWLDATATGQGGSLGSVEQADYGLALVIAPGTAALENIPSVKHDAPSILVRETFDFRAGTRKTASFTVTTEYRDAEADSMRAELRNKPASKLAADYVDYYRGRYPGLSAKSPLKTRDDREKNVIVVEETYEIATPFEEGDNGKRKFVLEAYLVSDRTRKPQPIVRTTPLARAFPVNVEQQVVAYLPGEWNIKAEKVDIANDAFTYHSTTKFQDGKLELDYQLRHTSDHVTPEALPAFVKQLSKVNDDAYLTLTEGAKSPPAKSGRKSSSAFALSTIVGLVLGGALVFYLWNLNAPPRPTDPDAPVGIVGWMILPVIGTTLSPFVTSLAWVQWEKTYGTEAALSGHGVGTQLLSLAVTANLGLMFVLSLVVVSLLFRRRNSFPRGFVILQASSAPMAICTAFIVGLRESSTHVEIFQQILSAIWNLGMAGLWIAYMLVSKRVRATFTKPPGVAMLDYVSVK